VLGGECVADDDLRDITKDLRRTVFLAEAVELALVDRIAALAAPEEATRDRAMRAALFKHLGDAWSDGSGRELDLRSALDVLRAQVDLLKRNNRELLKRVSKSREEPDEP